MRKKTILTMVLLLATVMLIPLSGCKNKKVIPVFTYEKNEDDTITITGLTDKGRADSKLTIPAQLDGSTVTAVAGEAFRDDYNVTEVVFEEGVKSIGDNVFLNCTDHCISTVTGKCGDTCCNQYTLGEEPSGKQQ